MAGAGWHDFVPGEVLTAGNVQDFLQDQAVMKFASAAARTSALPAPSQGMMSFLNDSGAVETYYAAWNATTNPGGKTPAGWYPARNSGLIPIIPPTIRVSGGAATINSLGKVTATGVTSLGLDGIFTDAYTNYVLKLESFTAASADTNLAAQFTISGSATATGYYGHLGYGNSNASFTTYATYSNASSFSAMVMKSTGYTSWAASSDINIVRSNGIAARINTQSFPSSFGGHTFGSAALNNVSAHDGIRLAPGTGTVTFSIQVYAFNS